MSDEKKMINIGRFSGAVGLKGEVRVTLYVKDCLSEGAPVVCRRDSGDAWESEITSLRYQKGKAVIKISGVENRNDAEILSGVSIYMNEAEFAELPEGEYYEHELIGLRVIDTSSGSEVGTVSEVLEYPAQDILVVRREDGTEVMIPLVQAFVKSVDLERGLIEAELIEGIL